MDGCKFDVSQLSAAPCEEPWLCVSSPRPAACAGAWGILVDAAVFLDFCSFMFELLKYF